MNITNTPVLPVSEASEESNAVKLPATLVVNNDGTITIKARLTDLSTQVNTTKSGKGIFVCLSCPANGIFRDCTINLFGAKGLSKAALLAAQAK